MRRVSPLERTVDFAAVGRVAKRVELKSVRLIEISGKCEPSIEGTLVPAVNLECKPGTPQPGILEVICEYTFTAHSNQAQAVESTIKYLLVYEISGGAESPNAGDLAEFARANGTLNSWPFAREILYGLTSRMGYPPYTLPLMHFNTKPASPKVPTARDAEVKDENPVKS
jgi:preprotein translocase subunit SecB